MSGAKIVIPASTMRWINAAPRDRAVAVLLRHTARPPLAEGDEGFDLPITEEGVRIATELGALLGDRLRSLHASPVRRCVETAQCLAEGARRSLPIARDTLLGHPGAFVVHGGAGNVWRELGHETVMEHLVGAREGALSGIADADAAARFLAHRMLREPAPGIHVFVTHDSLVTAMAARLLGTALGREAWPHYLEGAWLWRDGAQVRTAYREHHGTRAAPLCSLSEPDVLGFARREINAVVDERVDARFFLAGGAFKTLLTGLEPRDLDLWAASEADRARLVGALRDRGASLRETRAYSEVFQLGSRRIDVPYNCSVSTLEDRLVRFDIGLSAVGVEHASGGAMRALIHPLALESVERRAVLLHKPLINPRHALTSLVRLRRYASELGYELPASEEAAIWSMFEAQPPEERSEMIARLHRSVGAGALEAELAEHTSAAQSTAE